jgi:hypothetical protein
MLKNLLINEARPLCNGGMLCHDHGVSCPDMVKVGEGIKFELARRVLSILEGQLKDRLLGF